MTECGAGMERRDEAVKRTSLRLSKGCVGGRVRGAQHNIGSAVPRYEGTEHKAEERHARTETEGGVSGRGSDKRFGKKEGETRKLEERQGGELQSKTGHRFYFIAPSGPAAHWS